MNIIPARRRRPPNAFACCEPVIEHLLDRGHTPEMIAGALRYFADELAGDQRNHYDF